MKRHNKNFLVLGLFGLVTGLLTSCNDIKPHAISVEEGDLSYVTLDKVSAKEGEVVTITITVPEGQEIDTIKINDTDLTISDTTIYTFEMPNEDVVIDITFKDIDINEVLTNFQNKQIQVELDITTNYVTEGYEDFTFTTHMSNFFGLTSSSFYEVNEEDGTVYIDEKYYKDEDGNLVLRELGATNEVYESTLSDTPISYDLVFGNPFNSLESSDFIKTEKGYDLTSGETKELFIGQISYYGGEMTTFYLLPLNKNTIKFYAESTLTETTAYSYFNVYDGTIEVTSKEELTVTPETRKEYTPIVESALNKMAEATSYTLDRERIVNGEHYDLEGIKVTEDAILTPPDTLFGITNESGYAIFDDGNWYYYEIVDGVVTPDVSSGNLGSGTEYTYGPIFDYLAPEVFIQVDETHYETKTDFIAYEALTYILEGDEAVRLGITNQFSTSGKLTLEIVDETLISYSYTLNYTEGFIPIPIETKVTISDVNTTTIDYTFTLPQTAEWFNDYIGSYSGSRYNGNTGEFENYTLVINSATDIQINGINVTNIVLEQNETVTFTYEGASCVITIDDWGDIAFYSEDIGSIEFVKD